MEDEKPAGHEHPPSARRGRYAAVGVLLGFGAPAGALLLRLLFMPAVRTDVLNDMQQNAFFYAYSLLATCIVFGLAGYVAGTQADRLRRAEAFYHQLADHDPLTGLFNSRAFRDRYRRAIERATRLGETTALLVIDVDHLKQINDSQGHARGSAALIRVADAIRAGKRDSDAAARWGGDEFAVLLEGADAAAARRTADAIRNALSARAADGSTPPVTVTIGVAAGEPRDRDDDLFVRADAALYAGKREGRNRVTIAQ